LELELKYGADQVLALIIPVSLCMVVVIATLRSVTYFSTQDTQFV
jgi:presenilin 1